MNDPPSSRRRRGSAAITTQDNGCEDDHYAMHHSSLQQQRHYRGMDGRMDHSHQRSRSIVRNGAFFPPPPSPWSHHHNNGTMPSNNTNVVGRRDPNFTQRLNRSQHGQEGHNPSNSNHHHHQQQAPWETRTTQRLPQQQQYVGPNHKEWSQHNNNAIIMQNNQHMSQYYSQSFPEREASHPIAGCNNRNRNFAVNNTNSNNNPSTKKKTTRATNRRVKHDLPGPAGIWFRKQKQSAAGVGDVGKKKIVKTENGGRDNAAGGRDGKKQNDDTTAFATTTTTIDNYEAEGQHMHANPTTTKVTTSSNNNQTPSPSSSSFTKKQLRREEQLFHDHSTELHECNAWNLMCITLNRIVPPPHSYSLFHRQPQPHSYKHLLRQSIPLNIALIYEIHEGLYDTHHLSPRLFNTDLRTPLLIGYVASVQCHAHSDWTALLVDEMHGVWNTTTSGGGCVEGGGMGSASSRGIVCWIEERLVKRHAGWVRPGAVWMLEGAKLALFPSSVEDDDEGGDHVEQQQLVVNGDVGTADGQTNIGGQGVLPNDISPSTDAARGGGNIDRMILVGESSLVYAWTPEEASAHFSNEEFVELTERRCNVGFSSMDVIEIDGGNVDDTGGAEEDVLDIDQEESSLGEVVERSNVSDSVEKSRNEESTTFISSMPFRGSSPVTPTTKDKAIVQYTVTVELQQQNAPGNTGDSDFEPPASFAEKTADDAIHTGISSNDVSAESAAPTANQSVKKVYPLLTPTTTRTAVALRNPYNHSKANGPNPNVEQQTENPNTRVNSSLQNLYGENSSVPSESLVTDPMQRMNAESGMLETDAPHTKVNNEAASSTEVGRALPRQPFEEQTPVAPRESASLRPATNSLSFDSMLDEDEVLVLPKDPTPKMTQQIIPTRTAFSNATSKKPALCPNTGDSFDDMLDEDEDDMALFLSKQSPAITTRNMNNALEHKPAKNTIPIANPDVRKVVENTLTASTEVESSPARIDAQVPNLFATLGDDDLADLGEDDDL